MLALFLSGWLMTGIGSLVVQPSRSVVLPSRPGDNTCVGVKHGDDDSDIIVLTSDGTLIDGMSQFYVRQRLEYVCFLYHADSRQPYWSAGCPPNKCHRS